MLQKSIRVATKCAALSRYPYTGSKNAIFGTPKNAYFGKKGYFGPPKRVKKGVKKVLPRTPQKVGRHYYRKTRFWAVLGGGGGGRHFPLPGTPKPRPKWRTQGGDPCVPPPGGGDRVAKTGFSDPPLKSAFCLFGYPRTPGALLGGIAAPLEATPWTSKMSLAKILLLIFLFTFLLLLLILLVTFYNYPKCLIVIFILFPSFKPP